MDNCNTRAFFILQWKYNYYWWRWCRRSSVTVGIAKYRFLLPASAWVSAESRHSRFEDLRNWPTVTKLSVAPSWDKPGSETDSDFHERQAAAQASNTNQKPKFHLARCDTTSYRANALWPDKICCVCQVLLSKDTSHTSKTLRRYVSSRQHDRTSRVVPSGIWA